VNNYSGNNLSDKDLVDNILNGNTGAFAAIIKASERLVAQIVYKMIPNAEDRKDIAQDVYLKAFHKLDGFRFQSKLSTWIAKIAYNDCLSWLAKKKLVFPGGFDEDCEANEDAMENISNRSMGGTHAEPEMLLLRKERAIILQAEMDKLPPVYKTLLSLYHQEELKYEEMATITGLPEGTVKSYLFRARKALRENLLAGYNKAAL